MSASPIYNVGMKIEIWSDIACPWCWVGKRRLEKALETTQEKVEITWRAFELDPSAPKERPGTQSEHLAAKYGRTKAQADQMLGQMTDTGKQDGLDFRFDKVKGGNTFDGHRLIHFAGEKGKQDAVKERLLRAYMTEGALMSDPETLVRLGAECGLDAEEVRAMLASDACTKEVREDEALARELGISGVPFFVLDGKYAISGAQPAEVFTKALAMAASEAKKKPTLVSEGDACGPDGCAV